MNAALCTRKWGVSPSVIHHISCNNFRISDFFRDCFYQYRLVYWCKDYLLHKIVAGVITQGDTDFIVIYHNCTRGQLLNAPNNVQVALSFRAAKDDFKVVPYVLVSIPK